jgi:hypothetical protein
MDWLLSVLLLAATSLHADALGGEHVFLSADRTMPVHH